MDKGLKYYLSRPFQIKTLNLKNRVVMAPMTRSQSPEYCPTDQCLTYYNKRAKGGLGLIITEGIAIDHEGSQGYPHIPYLMTPQAKRGWHKIVDAVHKSESKVLSQLWHVGSVRQQYQKSIPGGMSFGPSKIIHPQVQQTQSCPHPPKPMNQNDINDVIQSFTRAAACAKSLGFDGIELHGAHGYLIDQFFWSKTNRRKDRYGGNNIANCTQFAVEIIKNVRLEVGANFPIILRISQWKLGDLSAANARSPNELKSLILPLVEAGVDSFHCSMHQYFKPEFPQSALSYAGWVKKLSGKPVIAAGCIGFSQSLFEDSSELGSSKINDQLVRKLSHEEFDLVAVGRPLLADPNWCQKILENRYDEVTPFSREQLFNPNSW